MSCASALVRQVVRRTTGGNPSGEEEDDGQPGREDEAHTTSGEAHTTGRETRRLCQATGAQQVSKGEGDGPKGRWRPRPKSRMGGNRCSLCITGTREGPPSGSIDNRHGSRREATTLILLIASGYAHRGPGDHLLTACEVQQRGRAVERDVASRSSAFVAIAASRLTNRRAHPPLGRRSEH